MVIVSRWFVLLGISWTLPATLVVALVANLVGSRENSLAFVAGPAHPHANWATNEILTASPAGHCKSALVFVLVEALRLLVLVLLGPDGS